MKTVIRQDGTKVELEDLEAAKWVKLGIGTYPVIEVKQEQKAKVQTDQGEAK